MAKTSDASGSYDDIIHLPHHVSQTRLPMSARDRAAQFSPFQSLTGLNRVMQETERQTVRKIELDEHEKARIDEKLRSLQERIAQQPEIFVVYFQPDPYKDGGNYLEMTGALRRIDKETQEILFQDGKLIPLDNIYAIESEDFKIK